MNHYILVNKEPKSVSLMEWVEWFENSDKRIVAQIQLRRAKVSTVFLGLDHRWGDGSPLLFETMIFGGRHDNFQDRYTTWDESELGHYKVIELAMVRIDHIDRARGAAFFITLRSLKKRRIAIYEARRNIEKK